MAKTSQAQMESSEKYRRANIRQILVKVNKKTQPTIYGYLADVENTQRYILDLVVEDMKRKGISVDE